jgi:peptidoglycan/xylan/chitin deacetylase (PgdA/CDA1 family)
MLWRSGVAAMARYVLTRNRRFVLEFHGVARDEQPGLPAFLQPSMNAAKLYRVLKWLQDRFEFLTPESFFGGAKSGVLLTFDDGLSNNYTVALPILAELSAPAVFFVTTQHVCHPQNWLPASRDAAQQLQALSVAASVQAEFFNGLSEAQLHACADHPLITIGSHTVSHPRLTQLTEAELCRELVDSKAYLEGVIDHRVDLFAYPYGDYDRRVVAAVQLAGYRAAFVEKSRHLGQGQFEIPRVGLYQDDPPYLSLKLSGLHQPAIKAPTS